MSLTKVNVEATPSIFSLPYIVARDENYFVEEGLDVVFTKEQDHTKAFAPIEDHELVSSFGHFSSFEEGESSLYRACEWGQIRRTQDGNRGGRIVSKRASVASQAIVVRPDSPLSHPQDLAGVDVAVNFHHGSHYLAIQSLEGFLEPEEIKVIHLGAPRERFEGLRDGVVDAAALMEPWISLAEQQRYKIISEAYYVGSEIASPDLDAETLAAIDRAVKRAVAKINEDPAPWAHYITETIPAEVGALDPSELRLNRLRYVDPAPYPAGEFDRTYKWLVRWGLISGEDTFQSIVDNRIAAAS